MGDFYATRLPYGSAWGIHRGVGHPILKVFALLLAIVSFALLLVVGLVVLVVDLVLLPIRLLLRLF